MFGNAVARCLPPTVLSLGLLAVGCAAEPGQQRAARSASIQCPAGTTVTCEADTIGRIHHGSFSKNLKRCACVPEDFDLPASPVIPSIRQ